MTYWQLGNREWLCDRYEIRGMSILRIADVVGCDESSVRLALRRHNIARRPAARPATTQGHRYARDGLGSPTYCSWQNMTRRCSDPARDSWDYYGGRGIRVCERWRGRDGFTNFLADMGERPDGATLDRIDSNGHYEASNCQWSTILEQARNRNPWGTSARTTAI